MSEQRPLETLNATLTAQSDKEFESAVASWEVALEMLPNAVIIYDGAGNIRYLNRIGRLSSGVRLDDVVGRRDEDVFPAQATQAYKPLLDRVYATKQAMSGEFVFERREPSGITSPISYAVTYTPVLDANGDIESVVGITSDLTVERRLEREASQFEAVAASPRDTLVTAALNGTILNFNRGAENIYGYRANEVIGKHLCVLWESSASARARELLDRATSGEVIEYQGRRRHKQGHVIELSSTLSPVRNPRGEIIAVAEFGRDVSERRALERRALDAQHLETIARAVAGVAHDLNDVFTVIETYVGLAADGSLNEQQRGDLGMAGRAARRGAALVAELLALHRGPLPEQDVADLNAVLAELSTSFARLFGETVAVRAEPCPGRLVVRANVRQLQKLLLSLLDCTRMVFPADRERVIVTAVLAGEHAGAARALVAVRTSQAPDAERLRTQHENEVSLLRELAFELGGALSIDEAAGERPRYLGVLLPLVEAVGTEAQPEQKPAEKRVVLLAEDDPAIRTAMRRVLQREGYEVLESGSGDEAEHIAETHAGPIHVMVCDQRMPGSRGLDAIARVRAQRRQIKAILISGHPAEHAVSDDIEFLKKPFSNDELAAAVARAASASPRAPEAAPLNDRPVVLLVDDDAGVRASLPRLLAECKLTTLSAPSALHALQILGTQRIDVVVADQIMPGMDGVQLLGVVRDRWPDVHRVLFTGYPSSDVVLEAVNRGGVNKVLVKSMHPLEIRNEIEASALEAARQRQQ